MRTRTAHRGRLLLAAVVAWVPATVVLVAWWAWSSELPQTVPVHWSGIGRPDGFAGTGTAWSWSLGVAIVAAAAACVALANHRRSPGAARGVTAVVVAAGAVGAAVWLVSATATLASGAAESAQLGWRVTWVGLALAWGAVPYALVGTAPIAPRGTAPPIGGLPMAPGERAAWTVTLRSRLFVVIPVVAALVVLFVAVAVEPWIALLVTVPAVVLALFCRVRVSVDRRGLRVFASLVGLPLKRIPLSDVAAASVEHIEPRSWGGWGYRVMPGRSALVLRSGPGLVLDLHDGRRFAVTVDDPETPTALLTTLGAGPRERGRAR